MEYYQNPQNNTVYGYFTETQQKLIDEAIANGWINVTASFPFPASNEQLLADCKSKATTLLYSTDWTTIADVANPTNNPYLTNQEEFIAYRNIVRGYAVNPVTNPTFPTVPTAKWSN
jgi:hypothetical protein